MPETDLALLLEAAREAGEIAMSHFKRDPQVWDKPGDEGPVTEADLAVDAHLSARLRAARPDYGWLSEETQDDVARLQASRVFVVDPIDGTRSFIRGDRDWGHALAVVEDGVPVAGVVLMPARDLTFAAASGQGATCNGQPIAASAQADPAQSCVLATKPNMAAQHWRAGPPAFQRSFRSSLAYRLSLVAQGRFDAMLTLRPAWEWDIAAGALIVTEAGGQITDRRGAPLRFNSENRLLDGVVAGGAVVPALLDALA
ncbi:3'(2'),5'-bisphosphate nucleotidase CysQ [Salipiger sp. IMCC34102]|uniref:3'(2'),5'-bisphosphate nucleotidase CysQ n=1 Tax=Salipiger sp. IMCC34102 TaxID=2510647 RepID=UPI00101BFE37|nr:3'(2'),5'-bisphosphate nucleotidase CysQ [Salipiger sp. IMCC34102]RYH04020.1 3'(2'),5'-bisphosphate nucleotidase CysQ [Salipiger sp. IMCC34102]